MIFYDYNLRYEIRKLEDNETIKSFDCGDADLNDFIINEAHHYRKALLAVTYIFEDKGTTVDAYNNAIPFYRNNNFKHLKEQEEDKITSSLYFDLNDIY